jgi:hypothetical protein
MTDIRDMVWNSRSSFYGALLEMLSGVEVRRDCRVQSKAANCFGDTQGWQLYIKVNMLLRNINYESPEVSHSHLHGSDTDAKYVYISSGCASHYFSYSQCRNKLSLNFLSNSSLLPHPSFQDKILNLQKNLQTCELKPYTVRPASYCFSKNKVNNKRIPWNQFPELPNTRHTKYLQDFVQGCSIRNERSQCER